MDRCEAGAATAAALPALPRHNNFDFLRLALASVVVFSHSFALLSGTDETEPLMRLTAGRVCSGELAVDGFFVISGFLVAHSFLRRRGVGGRKGVIDFLRRRARRIYPGYAVAMLVCAVVVAPLASDQPANAFTWEQSWRLLRGTLTLKGYPYDGAFPHNALHALNGSMWSISYEAWCYVGLALIGAGGLLRRRRLVLAGFGVAILVSVAFAAFGLRPGGRAFHAVFGSPRTWARLLPYFAAGVTFYLYRDRVPRSDAWAALAAVVLVAAASWGPSWGTRVALPTAGAYLLLWFAFHPRVRLGWVGAAGDFSYGTYLYAFPIQQLLIHWMPSIGPLQLFALALPLSLAAGVVSWHAVERWYVRRGQREGAPTLVDANPTPAAGVVGAA